MASTGASPEAYEAVIAAVSKCISDIGQACQDMGQAATDCVDNCEGDPLAAKAQSKLSEKLQVVQQNLETMGEVVAALQAELERMLEEAQANSGKIDSL